MVRVGSPDSGPGSHETPVFSIPVLSKYLPPPSVLGLLLPFTLVLLRSPCLRTCVPQVPRRTFNVCQPRSSPDDPLLRFLHLFLSVVSQGRGPTPRCHRSAPRSSHLVPPAHLPPRSDITCPCSAGGVRAPPTDPPWRKSLPRPLPRAPVARATGVARHPLSVTAPGTYTFAFRFRFFLPRFRGATRLSSLPVS